MKKERVVVLFGFAFLSLHTPAFADPQGMKWIEKADRYRSPGDSFSVSVQVTDVRGSEKKESRYRVSVKGRDLALVEQTAPERLRGRKLLMRSRDLWLYSPNVSRPTRISFEQKLTGEVSNGDLMRTNFADDYDATVTGEDSVHGTKTIRLHLVAKEKGVTYHSIDYWLDRTNARPVRAVFYALSGKPMKTATYLEFKPQLGASRLVKVEIVDAIENRRKSLLTYASYKREKFDDAFFSKESLGR